MNVDFSKYPNSLVPAIVQDAITGKVLMLGFMNQEAFDITIKEKRVTFFSRSKNRLWTKGETSSNYLEVAEIRIDCDGDTILIKANPTGPVCHTGADTCFNEQNNAFTLGALEAVIQKRKTEPSANSYTATLFAQGINKIAQKVGEEAVELVIESKDTNRERFLDEAADLLFHYLVLLNAKGENLQNVIDVLGKRHKK